MRHERLRTFFISWVLSLIIGVGSMLCMITAFDLSMARFTAVLVCFAAVSGLESFLFSRRNGNLIVLILLAAAAGALWFGYTFSRQVTMLIVQIANLWDDAYHWGGFVVPEFPPYVDEPVAALNLLLITLVNRSISGRKPPLAPIFLGVLCLLLCMAAPNTIPDTAPLLLLLAGLALLAITGSTRQESAAQGNRLVLAAALPVLLLTGVLLLAFPENRYTDQSEQIRSDIVRQLQRVPGLLPEEGELRQSTSRVALRSAIDLAGLSGQSNQAIPVMEVTAQNTETLYLRGQDFDVYTSTGWESSPDRQEEISGWGEALEDITIRTFRPHDVLYLPYFPAGTYGLSQGSLLNSDNLLQYIVTRSPMGGSADPDTLSRYLELPDSTAAALLDYLPEEKLSTRKTAEQIAAAVRGCARYDRQTGKMPESETDFVCWFLASADTGYCVHFASASVALLRAAGIPARYVTGYKVDAVAGETITVTSLDAHAWAEYYDEQMGSWRILEATPAAGENTPPQATAAAQTENTERPAETAAPTAAPQAKAPEASRKPVPLWPFLLLPLLMAAAIIQRYFRLVLRRYLLQRSSNNRRALQMWQESDRLSKLLKAEPPEKLTILAEKAKYSQHTLQDGELTPFDEYRAECLRTLRKKPWYLRLIAQYIYALC